MDDLCGALGGMAVDGASASFNPVESTVDPESGVIIITPDHDIDYNPYWDEEFDDTNCN